MTAHRGFHPVSRRSRRATSVLALLTMLASLLAVTPPAVAQPTQTLCGVKAGSGFGDVSASDYGAAYIACAKELGLAKGRTDSSFQPEEQIDRAEMAAFLARLWRDTLSRGCPAGGHPFTDTASSFADGDIACIWNLGIAKGTSATTYRPAGTVTAAQLTLFLMRLLNAVNSGTCDLSGDEFAKAAQCAVRLNVAPSTSEASSVAAASRAKMAVYLVGAWHRASGRGTPPAPPSASHVEAPISPSSPPRRLAAGDFHNCALLTNSSVTCWGLNHFGQLEAPSGSFREVTSGAGHSCALRFTTEVVCWGHKEHGQSNAPLRVFQTVEAGDWHTCGLLGDSSALCWGNNDLGQSSPPPDGSYTALSAVLSARA